MATNGTAYDMYSQFSRTDTFCVLLHQKTKTVDKMDNNRII